MSALIDISGQRFGRLVAVKFVAKKWECICDCGKVARVGRMELMYGDTRSCGCLAAEVRKVMNRIHGKSRTSIYNIWSGIKQRCYNEKCEAYPNYGGRGILMDERWRYSFEAFYEDVKDSYKEGLTCERIDVNKGYFKENVTWIPFAEQRNNCRDAVYITYNGKTMKAKGWAKELGIPESTVRTRLQKGYPVELVLSTHAHKNQLYMWKESIKIYKEKVERLEEVVFELSQENERLTTLVKSKL